MPVGAVGRIINITDSVNVGTGQGIQRHPAGMLIATVAVALRSEADLVPVNNPGGGSWVVPHMLTAEDGPADGHSFGYILYDMPVSRARASLLSRTRPVHSNDKSAVNHL